MSIKYIGLFAIFIACTAVGFGLAGNEGKRLKNNEALIFLIRYIRQRIGYFKSSTSEIYQSFENDLFEKNGFTAILREEGLYSCPPDNSRKSNSLFDFPYFRNKHGNHTCFII